MTLAAHGGTNTVADVSAVFFEPRCALMPQVGNAQQRPLLVDEPKCRMIDKTRLHLDTVRKGKQIFDQPIKIVATRSRTQGTRGSFRSSSSRMKLAEVSAMSAAGEMSWVLWDMSCLIERY